MKKFITLFVAVIMAISVFAFSACGKDNNSVDPTPAPVVEEKGVSGSIEGNYNTKVELDADDANYQLLATRLSGDIHPVVNNQVAGGTAQAEADINLTIGDKSLTISMTDLLNLILDISKMDKNGLDAISGLYNKMELNVKSDDGFGTAAVALGDQFTTTKTDESDGDDVDTAENNEVSTIKAALAMLNALNVKTEIDAYVKDTNVYVNAKANGIPEAVKTMIPEGSFDLGALETGLQYKFTEEFIQMIVGMFSGRFGGGEKNYFDDNDYYPIDEAGIEEDENENSLQAAKFGQELPSETDSESDTNALTMVMGIASMIGADIYADISDNEVKLKIAITDSEEMRTKLSTLASSIISSKTEGVVTNFVISKLNIELYAAINANKEITAVAGKIDVAVSASVGTTNVSLAVKGALDLSFNAPAAIEFPSFDAYVDVMALMQQSSQGQDWDDNGDEEIDEEIDEEVDEEVDNEIDNEIDEEVA